MTDKYLIKYVKDITKFILIQRGIIHSSNTYHIWIQWIGSFCLAQGDHSRQSWCHRWLCRLIQRMIALPGFLPGILHSHDLYLQSAASIDFPDFLTWWKFVFVEFQPTKYNYSHLSDRTNKYQCFTKPCVLRQSRGNSAATSYLTGNYTSTIVHFGSLVDDWKASINMYQGPHCYMQYCCLCSWYR